jgi:hypothetical protein
VNGTPSNPPKQSNLPDPRRDMPKAFRQPTWVYRLSNAALLDAFGATYEVRENQGDRPDLMFRLDLLHNEIVRREGMGLLTDEDWKDKA